MKLILEPGKLNGSLALKVHQDGVKHAKGHFKLHTWVKSRLHETMRAWKKVSKGRPNTPPKSCNVVTNPHVYVFGPSTKCYYNEILFMRVFAHDKIEYINGYEHSECHGLPVLC